MERRARLTGKGQVTIPSDIRRALRAREGDHIIFMAEDGVVSLRVDRPTSVFAEHEGILREGEGRSIEQILGEIRELRGDLD